MATLQTIGDKIGEAGTTTLDAARRTRSEAALAAIVESRIVTQILEEGRWTLQTLPVPPISRQFEVQLEALWRSYQAPGADREGMRGAFDRIVAQLYELSVADLAAFELATDR